MYNFTVNRYHDDSIFEVYHERMGIELVPEYQRISGIWNLEKKQLLIDSLLNGFDVPKLYFHRFSPPKQCGDHTYNYAIIDGKQRLQAIWDFIDGKFPIDESFIYLRDESVKAGGLTYSELAAQHPLLRTRFDARNLDVVTIETSDISLIEDLFSRLNEAAPLNAPEKRNAFGGPLPPLITETAQHSFFIKNVHFPDARYRHRDLAAKFLFIEHTADIVNTKKVDLDSFVREFKRERDAKDVPRAIARLRADTTRTLDTMRDAFTERDVLLRQVGMITLYYHLFRLIRTRQVSSVARHMLSAFDAQREKNREHAENTSEHNMDVNTYLLEFDKHSQTPNDAYALKIRLRILLSFLGEKFAVTHQDDLNLT